MRLSVVTSAAPGLVCSREMEPAPRPTLQPAGAGAILVSGTALGAGLGALVGWAVGSVGIGALIGVALGIPAGIYGVYRRYRGFFT